MWSVDGFVKRTFGEIWWNYEDEFCGELLEL